MASFWITGEADFTLAETRPTGANVDEQQMLNGVKGSTQICTGQLGLKPAKVNPAHTIWVIRDKNDQGVLVKFNQETHLSIFQHDMFYCLFFLKKKPRDFAKYFKCPAGKEFLTHIEKIWVLEVVQNPQIIKRLVAEAKT